MFYTFPLSISILLTMIVILIFPQTCVIFCRTIRRKQLLQLACKGGLYILDTHVSISTCNSVVSSSFETRHLRLGHASHSSLQIMAKYFPCNSCHYAKQKKLPFSNINTCTHS